MTIFLIYTLMLFFRNWLISGIFELVTRLGYSYKFGCYVKFCLLLSWHFKKNNYLFNLIDLRYLDRKNLKSNSSTKWATSFFIRLTSLIERARVARFSFRAEFELGKWYSIELKPSIEHQILSRARACYCIGSTRLDYTPN